SCIRSREGAPKRCVRQKHSRVGGGRPRKWAAGIAAFLPTLGGPDQIFLREEPSRTTSSIDAGRHRYKPQKLLCRYARSRLPNRNLAPRHKGYLPDSLDMAPNRRLAEGQQR